MTEWDGFSADAHRYLDGEPFEELSGTELAAADRLAAEVRDYAARLAPVDPALDERVMTAVRRRAPARRRSGLAWLMAPRTVKLRPVWVPVLAAAAALVVWLAPRGNGGSPVPVAAAPARASADTVFVRFELEAPQARSVSVAGSFNGWQVGALTMVRDARGVWSATAPLPVGEHRYEFVIDGTRWVPDPTAHAEVDDGFGGRNSVIVVGPKGLVRS
ncbi:MAG TPA: isoamylase early set domain-containing protein [Gemmatimonadales bacterium]|nr:isoamylase early set domain-containing protein [Gemmatimonadales bacterium]